MKKQSLKDILYLYLLKKKGAWVHSGTLEKVSERYGKKGSTGSRRLRELHEEAFIWRKLKKNKKTNIESVWYSVQ